MGKILDATITCPTCKRRFETEVHRVVWGEYPQNRELVFSDQINSETCRCGTVLKLPFAFLFTNRDREFAVWYEPRHDPVIDEDALIYAEAWGADSYLATAPRISDWETFKLVIRDFEEGRRQATPVDPTSPLKTPLIELVTYARPARVRQRAARQARPRPAPTAIDLVEAAERRYAHDPKRLRQLAMLRNRVEEDIRKHGLPPSPELLMPLLALVDKGVLPTPGQVSGIVTAVQDKMENEILARLTPLDREVASMCQFVYTHRNSETPIALSAVLTSLSRGVIIATDRPYSVDDMWPSHDVIDPITGDPDVETTRLLGTIASDDFRDFVQDRFENVVEPTLAMLFSAYESRVGVPMSLDQSDQGFESRFTATIKHALIFGLWFGQAYPAHSRHIVAELLS